MSPTEIDAVVVGLIDRITARMRAAGRSGRTVVLRLRFDDFSRATRSRTLPWATSSAQPILAAARQLVAAAAPMIAQRGLTLVGFAVSGIDRSGAQQLMLPFGAGSPPLKELDNLDTAVDQIRRRYGKSALTRGVLVGRDPGFETPHLPD
jgi:DNA polymerase IV